MGKTGRPGPTLDDYLYWQERLKGRGASGLSIDEFCVDEGVSGQHSIVGCDEFATAFLIRSKRKERLPP